MASIGLLLAIAGGMVVRDRFVTKSIRDGDDQLHKRINEVKDVYVRRDDLNQHITRLERAVEDVKGELREMRRHHELVITTMPGQHRALENDREASGAELVDGI